MVCSDSKANEVFTGVAFLAVDRERLEDLLLRDDLHGVKSHKFLPGLRASR